MNSRAFLLTILPGEELIFNYPRRLNSYTHVIHDIAHALGKTWDMVTIAGESVCCRSAVSMTRLFWLAPDSTAILMRIQSHVPLKVDK